LSLTRWTTFIEKENRLQPAKAMRIYVVLIGAIGWYALALQFYLEVNRAIAHGLSVSATIINYFSYFTILTNLLVVVGLAFSLWMPHLSWGQFFSSPIVETATAVYITIVGLTYSLLLRHLWNPQGLQNVADILLHDVMPIMYVAYWLTFVPKDGLRCKHVLLWLTYPLAYLIYTLIHGRLSGWYPYPFVDLSVLGYPRFLLNVAMLLGAFLGIGLLAVAIGRWTARNSPASNERQKLSRHS
jgi:hypothetical protein